MAKSNFLDPERPNTGVEACFNLICLCANAHIWNKGLFALKPLELSSDRKKLKVQFFWQPRYDHKVGDKIDLLTEPPSSEGLDSIDDEYFLNYRGGDKIISGQVFTLKTEDPEEQPLPSWDLLDMQWCLQRLAGMCGAAGWPRLNFDDGDDD